MHTAVYNIFYIYCRATLVYTVYRSLQQTVIKIYNNVVEDVQHVVASYPAHSAARRVLVACMPAALSDLSSSDVVDRRADGCVDFARVGAGHRGQKCGDGCLQAFPRMRLPPTRRARGSQQHHSKVPE